MNKLLDNKWILIIATLIVGVAVGWIANRSFQEPESVHEHVGSADHQETSAIWTCSMHPQIRAVEPGQCPICGMSLIPVGTNDSGDGNSLEIKMSPTAMQLASVQTAIVRKSEPFKKISLNGKIKADESAVYTQTTHLSGRVEKLLINTTGEYISKGQIIALIYSPELILAQEELFEAQKIKSSQPVLFVAAKEKLKNWKLTAIQIENILASGKPSENFPIRSDFNGVITSKYVSLGDYVKKGKALFEVSNLNKVWVQFEVYERDLSLVRKGDVIAYSIQSYPGEKFEGKISFIDPVVNAKTRVAKARVMVNNRSQRLKPEMFVSGVLEASLPKGKLAITVPKSAVMWTGERSIIYVKTSENRGVNFLLREVTLGLSLGDSYVISKGLEEGEEIAINGAFSIDAAAQLAGKPSMMNPKGGMAMIGHNHGNMSKATFKEIITNDAKEALASLFQSYFQMKRALSDDNFERALEAGRNIKDDLSKIESPLSKGASHDIWMKQSTVLKAAVEHISRRNTIEEVRSNFMTISNGMIDIAVAFNPLSGIVYIQHCPMANDNNGADWLSAVKEIQNPYFGQAMHSCGETTKTLK